MLVCLCLRESLWNLASCQPWEQRAEEIARRPAHSGQKRLSACSHSGALGARLEAGRGQPEEASFICFKGGQVHGRRHGHGNAVKRQKLAKAKHAQSVWHGASRDLVQQKGLPIQAWAPCADGSSATESLHFQGMNFHSVPEACLKAKAKSLDDGMEESSRTSEGYFLRKSCFKANVFSGDNLAGNVSCHDDAGSDEGCPGGPAADGATAGGGKPGAEGKGMLQVMMCALCLCQGNLRSAKPPEGSPIKPKSVNQASN